MATETFSVTDNMFWNGHFCVELRPLVSNGSDDSLWLAVVCFDAEWTFFNLKWLILVSNTFDNQLK